MAKPILLIKTASYISMSEIHGLSLKIGGKFDDYHILVIPSKLDETAFEVLNGEKLDPITIEELKAKLNNG
jgi:hypothetical protein